MKAVFRSGKCSFQTSSAPPYRCLPLVAVAKGACSLSDILQALALLGHPWSQIVVLSASRPVVASCVVMVGFSFAFAPPLPPNWKICSHLSHSVLPGWQCAGPGKLTYIVELHPNSCDHFFPLWHSQVFHFERGELPLWPASCGWCTSFQLQPLCIRL